MMITVKDLQAARELLDVATSLGLELCALSMSRSLSAQISGYHRPEAISEVDLLADTLRLPQDDGRTGNYDRRGPVALAGGSYEVAIYTARPEACPCGLCVPDAV